MKGQRLLTGRVGALGKSRDLSQISIANGGVAAWCPQSTAESAHAVRWAARNCVCRDSRPSERASTSHKSPAEALCDVDATGACVAMRRCSSLRVHLVCSRFVTGRGACIPANLGASSKLGRGTARPLLRLLSPLRNGHWEVQRMGACMLARRATHQNGPMRFIKRGGRV